MTTTVTLKTHDWPAEVTLYDNIDYATSHQRVWGNTTTVETVAPNSERVFNITDTRSISFKELPKPEAVPAEPEAA